MFRNQILVSLKLEFNISILNMDGMFLRRDNIHEQKIAFYWKTRLLGESKYWWCSFIFASLKKSFYDTYYRWWVKVQQWMIMVILIYYFYILTHSTLFRKTRIILQWNIIDCRFLYTFHTTTVIKLRKALERWFLLYSL